MDKEKFARELLRRRNRLGWSKRRTGRFLDVHLATYARWEGGENTPLWIARGELLKLLDAAIRVKERV